MVAGVTGLLRTISFGIDMIIFGLVQQVTWLFSMLTEATIFTQEQMKAFSTRIYVLVSIIMLFKLGFSFINYIVNPDTISDKQKGGGKLIVNIVIVVGLLVSVPTIFNEAYHLQQVVFKNNIIDRILLGTAVNQQQTVERSQILSTYAFLSFYRPTIKVTECRSNKGLDISEECIKYLDNAEPDKKAGTAYQQSLEESNLGKLRDNGSVNITAVFATGNNNDFYQAEQDYVFDYHYIISTIFGCILAYIMIGFCLDMAIRAVKMGFLQIIAPIPILLSLTPGTKNNTLNNWAKECLTTWVSVFIRVAVISFALSAILLINEGGGVISIVSGGSNSYFMVNIFVMLGILLFAKEFPKLLEDILGIKNSGKITFNPWKKLGQTPLVGGLATAGLTTAGSLGLAAGRGIWGLTKSTLMGAKSKISGGDFGAGFKEGKDDTWSRMKARTGAGFASSKEKLSSAGIGGTDKLGGSMRKSYKENYRDKDYDKNKKQDKLGQKLLDEVTKRDNRGNYQLDEKGELLIDKDKMYDQYSSKTFSSAVRNMDIAKDRRDKSTSNYEKMKMEFESTGIVQGASNAAEAIAMVDKARISSLKASSDYDKLKVEFDKQKVLHKSDAEKYTAYTAAEDKTKATINVQHFSKSDGKLSSSQPGNIAEALAKPKTPNTGGVGQSESKTIILADKSGNEIGRHDVPPKK